MGKRKDITGTAGPNDDFCSLLNELSEYEKNVNRNLHKYKTYRTAAAALRKHHKRIENGEEAQQLPGIGRKIAGKIDEFLATGKLRKLDEIHKDAGSQAIASLTRVSGIGPAKARQLFDEGIKNVDDLRKHTDKLNHHQQIGLKYLNDFELKIPREEVEEIEAILRREIPSEFQLTICGSYRRGVKESGDVDVLITHPSYTSKEPEPAHMLKNIIGLLEKIGLIKETLSLGKTKFMGVCQLKQGKPMRRIDIRLFPADQYVCAVLYFTGSSLFNQQMRAHALEHGFTLNEYSLRALGATGAPGETIALGSEEEIFDYIDYPYRRPQDR